MFLNIFSFIKKIFYLCLNKILLFLSKRSVVVWLTVVLSLALFIFYFSLPPKEFPVKQIIVIEKGKTLKEISDYLAQKKLIKSSFLFNNYIIMLGKEKKVVSGEYFFDTPLNVYGLAKKIGRGEYGMSPIKVLIPEGSTVFEIGSILKSALKNFDENEFLKLAQNKEGYLFPDTYLFSHLAKADEVLAIMKQNFNVKIQSIDNEIKKSGKNILDIIKMASILEEEANTTESRKIISSILWKRIQIKMPLQVCASVSYVVGRNTFNLTADDLKVDSEYNTYKYKGLPIAPISNPGLDSIIAAITPIDTKYLYYLSDKDGKIYYAVNYEQHIKNRKKYLNK